MKRAPVIPRHTTHTQSTEDTSSPAPAAPMVDSLIARVGAMARGNAISLPVCGREVKFTLEVLRGDSVESASRVWSGNERDQELLTEDALDDLIPSFLLTGQQTHYRQAPATTTLFSLIVVLSFRPPGFRCH